MRRSIYILGAGLLGAMLAYCCSYLLGTAPHRALMENAQPELVWLKNEFNLSQTELDRISQVHAEYLPLCQERCRRIDELNNKLFQLLAEATHVTPELENLLRERAQMRATCQMEMLNHFFEVSRTMPPTQGKRYLAWVQEMTCLRERAMDHGFVHDQTSPVQHAP